MGLAYAMRAEHTTSHEKLHAKIAELRTLVESLAQDEDASVR
jgi:hypothetical protein